MQRHLFNLFMRPFEHAGLGRARALAWRQVPSAGRGLEIGAGTGANVAHWPRSSVVATDVSPGMLLGVRKREGGGRIPVVACDVETLPFRDGTFDWVAETLVFCEVPDVRGGLDEVARVLRPGGRFVLLEHVRPSGWLGTAADLFTRFTAIWGEHFNRDPLPALRAAGFTIERRIELWRDALVVYLCER